MEFTLLVAEHEGQTFVFTDLPDAAKEAIGDSLKTHTFTLKAPLQERQRQEYERLMWRNGQYDDSLRWAASAVAYLQSWTLPEPLTMEGAGSLHPALAQAVGIQTQNAVFPPVSNAPFYESLLNARLQTSPEPG